jgi:viroplasmin and RNaseH domain-containing protein
MSKQYYYAVWNGRKIGIYNSWNECKKHVFSHSKAGYKSFDSYDEAQQRLEKELKKVGKELPPEDSFKFPSFNF